MEDHEISTLRVTRTEATESIYVELVLFIEQVGPIEMGWKAGAAGISTTIIDGLAAVFTLVNSNGQGHTHAVARGLIEASIDLAILVSDPEYSQNLILATQHAVMKKLQRELDTGLLVSDSRHQVIAHLAETTRQVKELEGRGIKVLTIGPKFERSPLHYRTLRPYYDRWNAYVHNNFEAILNRHFKPHGLQFGDTVTDDEAQELLIIASLMAVETLKHVAQYARVDEAKALAEHKRLTTLIEEKIIAPMTLASGELADAWVRALP